MKVPIARATFDESEESCLLETLRSGWIVQGSRVASFEKIFSQRVDSPHAIAVSNCTSALHLSLVALGIGPGDEVVIPSFTFVATANAVEHAGARPVFCDVNPLTFNMDPGHLGDCISQKTKAVIPVHQFGLAADMEPIVSLCAEQGIKIVEDAACGLGSLYKGQHVGSFGDAACFSFHPRKIITTAEGGMITLTDDQIAVLLRSMRDQGASASSYGRHTSLEAKLFPEFNVLGYNYRMTDLQAALGIVQMEKLDGILNRRKEKALVYNRELGDMPGIRLPFVANGFEHNYQSYVITFTGGREAFSDPQEIMELRKERNGLMETLESKGVSTRPGAPAVHNLGYYRKRYETNEATLLNSLFCESATIALPLFHGMKDEEQGYVMDVLREAVSKTC